MKKNYIMMGIIVFLICGVLLYIGYGIENRLKPYKTLESDLVEAADVYFNLNDLYISNGEVKKITSKELIDANLIESLEVEEDNCEGYVSILKKSSEYVYKAYIKCNEYSTPED